MSQGANRTPIDHCQLVRFRVAVLELWAGRQRTTSFSSTRVEGSPVSGRTRPRPHPLATESTESLKTMAGEIMASKVRARVVVGV
jgi:hypothetical protein